MSDEKRGLVLQIRFSAEERAALDAGAELEGMATGAWLRWLGLRERRKQLAAGASPKPAENGRRRR